ncbi:DNA cytosine methyltransferase [Testudinibacter sp. TR-2022]|uniref:DNA cytosine methyltransferase n=1 Tax=Testudinibacter sp. TR-2022 TaxID=2585029 RepID=UPI00111AA98A|nr:DNA cytosine methyltransferase [Testudinibacter sp. TR-2022]TNH03433.1 DNA cytosine methyltransferase [Pasteurellaceae bacterium Phil11]TNH25506.1 DNA cytosine methyltransferase [Testudinibacter sp. TR-2022]TNH28076.1 DNA cytosine methyltransferase [Testudinibacter sp. TR-2022]
MQDKKKIQVFDFFSGCGGTSQGFKQAGMEVVFGLDFDKEASNTFQLNFPNAFFINDDITRLKVDCIKEIFGKSKKNQCYTLFSGCAPCQPFSTQNSKKSNSDPRRHLLGEFGRFVKSYHPDFVFIENVPGMQNLKGYSTPFFDFLSLLDELGYQYSYGIVSAMWFGVPQDRKRLILLASKHTNISLPASSFDGIKKPYSTVRDWIYELPEISHGQEHANIPDHKSASLNALSLLRIKQTPEGGGREDWQDNVKLKCHRHHNGHKDVYGRLSWDKPSSVLTTRCTSYSNGRFGHPEQDRALSLREAALLQTFPMNYQFSGTFNSKAKQIGNAVPPLMSEAVGRHILSTF